MQFQQRGGCLNTEGSGKKYTTINSKHSNIITNEKKKKVWTEIAEKTSSLGIAIRTSNEIKEKWNNLKKEANKVFTNPRQEQGKTGGGPRPNPISQAMESIIDLCKDSDSFKCLDGVDTCIQIQQDSDVFQLSIEVILNHFHFVFLYCLQSAMFTCFRQNDVHSTIDLNCEFQFSKFKVST